MNIFITAAGRKSFFSKSDKDKKFEFVLQPIGSLVLSYLVQKYKDVAASGQYSTELMLELIQFGLADVRGDGVPALSREKVSVPYIGEIECIDKQSINKLALPVIQELGAQIAADNLLTQDEEANF